MTHWQVTPEQAETVNYSAVLNEALEAQRSNPHVIAMNRQLSRLPHDYNVGTTRSVLPAVVYIPNKDWTPPSLALGEPEAFSSEFLHSSLKSRVRADQKGKLFSGAPITSGLITLGREGTRLFLDDDAEDAPKYLVDANREAFSRIYGIDEVFAGDEFDQSGLSLVGLARVISGAREKARLKSESEDSTVDRFLRDTFAAVARSRKSSEVYARLVDENSKYRSGMRSHPSASRYQK